MNDWISVKDRLPDDTRYVLCYGSSGAEPYVGYYAYHHDCKWYDYDNENSYCTHWMPLPEPPE